MFFFTSVPLSPGYLALSFNLSETPFPHLSKGSSNLCFPQSFCETGESNIFCCPMGSTIRFCSANIENVARRKHSRFWMLLFSLDHAHFTRWSLVKSLIETYGQSAKDWIISNKVKYNLVVVSKHIMEHHKARPNHCFRGSDTVNR